MSEPNPMTPDSELTGTNATSDELRNIIEAALLTTEQPLTIDRMIVMFPPESPPTREEIRAALRRLEDEYTGRAIELKKIDQAYRLQTRPHYAPFLARLAEERPARYSRALLETLAIIVYRQPCTRGDIENIRGVAVGTEIIKTLLDRDWVRQVGTREVPGRPALYATTRGFLEYFNLSRLDELPTLADLRDITAVTSDLESRDGQQPLALPLSPTVEEGADDADDTSYGSNPENDDRGEHDDPATHTAEEREPAVLSRTVET